MRLIQIPIIIFISTITIFSQQISFLTTLDESINESSGLIYIDNKLITHNDSGGEPALYELDSISGTVIRKVIIGNATNIDWEDICNDDKYIYIADFGNNNGSRKDLRIYKLSIYDYFNTVNDTVIADTINFSYKDQFNFTPSTYSTNFDAEAFISYKDSLYIFTKNWGDFQTNVYSIPKSPGTYLTKKINSINSQGLITGATYINSTNSILLTGYTVGSAIIIEINDFPGNRFSKGSINRYEVTTPKDYSYQIESIAYIRKNQYFITAEQGKSGFSALYKLNTGFVSKSGETENKDIFIYPNPATGTIQIQEEDLSIVEIYNLKGDLQKRSKANIIDISKLPKGWYSIIIKINNYNKTIVKKLVIE